MKLALAVLALGLAPAVAAAENRVMDNHQTVTYDCGKDAAVAILGNDNTITLTGKCDSVNLSGNHNTLTGPEAVTLAISGNHNTLNVDKVTNLNVSGNSNTLNVVKLAPADQNPRNSMSGRDNKIIAKEPPKPKKADRPARATTPQPK